jgi:hypothetical protein
MKIVTLCGSLRFKKEMMEVALKMLLFLLEVFYYKVLYSLQICNKM